MHLNIPILYYIIINIPQFSSAVTLCYVSVISSYTHLYKFKSPLFLSTPLCFSEQIIDQSWIFVGFLLIYAFYFFPSPLSALAKNVVVFSYPMTNITDRPRKSISNRICYLRETQMKLIRGNWKKNIEASCLVENVTVQELCRISFISKCYKVEG